MSEYKAQEQLLSLIAKLKATANRQRKALEVTEAQLEAIEGTRTGKTTK